MVRKSVAVWALGVLTFLAGLHTLDGFLWLAGNQVKPTLLPLYPFTRFLEPVDPVVYTLGSLMAMFVLWGGTAAFALQNPIEAFLGRVLEDGRRENQTDVELLETRTGILEMMSETLENNSKLLAGLRDSVLNVRSEVLGIEPLTNTVENLKGELESMKKVMKRLEREVKKYKLCPACGREIMAEFRLCPYCGENLLKPSVDRGSVMLAALPVSTVEKK